MGHCNRCCYCEELFWCDNEETDICPTCVYAPSEKENTERAVEQYIRYIQKVRKAEKLS